MHRISSPKDDILFDAIDTIWKNDEILIEIIHSSQINEYINPIASFTLEPIKSEEDFRNKVEIILQKKELSKGQRLSLENFLKITKEDN